MVGCWSAKDPGSPSRQGELEGREVPGQRRVANKTLLALGESRSAPRGSKRAGTLESPESPEKPGSRGAPMIYPQKKQHPSSQSIIRKKIFSRTVPFSFQNFYTIHVGLKIVRPLDG